MTRCTHKSLTGRLVLNGCSFVTITPLVHTLVVCLYRLVSRFIQWKMLSRIIVANKVAVQLYIARGRPFVLCWVAFSELYTLKRFFVPVFLGEKSAILWMFLSDYRWWFRWKQTDFTLNSDNYHGYIPLYK